MKPLLSLFFPLSPDSLREKQLRSAELALLEHEALREYHEAMARMLQQRIFRLKVPTLYPGEEK